MVGIRVCEPSLPNVPIPPPKKQFPYQQKENGFWNISFASYLCDGGFLFCFCFYPSEPQVFYLQNGVK